MSKILSLFTPWATSHIRFLWILNHASLPSSDTVDQLAKEATLIGTCCPTFLAQDLITQLANIIKSSWTLHYISHPSVARYYSIQPSPSSHPWFHNQSFPVSLISAIWRLCFGHTHFPAFSVHFGLPPLPLCLHHSISTVDHQDIFYSIVHVFATTP